jgi:EAL domain-containing protein (putative c-di-GMP-specific phosphodiesterase class I)
VLWAACRQARLWLDAGLAPVRIAVNVSALQFKAPIALEADVAATLQETGLPPHLLELELTETVLMGVARAHSDALDRLRTTGVMIAIDDFGTGYSSLEYLRRFPVRRIKIAQVFVKELETKRDDATIVRVTIGLARELGIDVIAEGVETEAQAKLIAGWGCKEAQGFLFSRPLSVEDATAALKAGVVRRQAPC